MNSIRIHFRFGMMHTFACQESSEIVFSSLSTVHWAVTPGVALFLRSSAITISFQMGSFENIKDINRSISGFSLDRWNSSLSFNILGLFDGVLRFSRIILCGFESSLCAFGQNDRTEVKHGIHGNYSHGPVILRCMVVWYFIGYQFRQHVSLSSDKMRP